MRPLFLLGWASVLTCLLVASGCGGGSSSATSGTSSGGSGTGTTPSTRLGATRLFVDPAHNTVQIVSQTGPATASSRAVYAGGAVEVTQATVGSVPSSGFNQELLSLNIAVSSAYYDPSLGPLKVSFQGMSFFGLRTQPLAGSGATGDTDGDSMTSASGHPYGTWVDTDGTVYFTQGDSGAIRRVKNGAMSTVSKGYVSPTGITGDANYLYFCDQGANKVYRITKNGISGIVLAGTGTAGFTNGTGAAATFHQPTGIAIEGTSLVVADYGNNAIRAVNISTGATTTFTTGILGPIGIATGVLDGQNVVVATGNSENKVHVYGTSGGSTFFSDAFGPSGLSGVAVLTNGLIVCSDAAHNRLLAYQFLTGSDPFAAASYRLYTEPGGTGNTDGISPTFNSPELLSVSGGGGVVLADNANNRVRSISFDATSQTGPTGVTFTNAAGFLDGGVPYFTTAPGNLKVAFSSPQSTGFYMDMVIDGPSVAPVLPGPGNPSSLFLEKIAGGTHYSSGSTIDGIGQQAIFATIQAVSPSRSGLIAIADFEDVAIANDAGRVVRLSGSISPTPTNGFGYSFSTGGVLTSIQMNDAGTVIMLTSGFAVFRMARLASSDPFDPNSWYGNLVAGGTSVGTALGNGTAARFNNPYVCFPKGTNAETCFIADSQNNQVKQIDLQGQDGTVASSYFVTLLAGSGVAGYVEGSGVSAQFNVPTVLTCGPDGTIYVGETNNHRIRSVTVAGQVGTIAGNGTSAVVDGSPGELRAVVGLDTDSSGNLIFADYFSDTIIRKVSFGQFSTSVSTIYTTSNPLLASTGMNTATGDIYWEDTSEFGKFAPIVNN